MSKLETLKFFLWKRSGLHLCDALARYLCGEMSEGQRGRVQVRCASAIPSLEGTTIIIKEIINMITKTISMCQGKGSLSHNNREFTAKNIDPSRTADNIVFIQQGK